ncbi:MAG TPA: PilZ domain-containing protein [Candidatus Koribacter sp.]|jgi:hypothetical protein
MESTRKHPRFQCNGTADLSDGAKGRLWGQVGDVCLGGFYLSTAGPWAVNTEVSFKLDFEGREIQGAGQVRTSHPGVGMAVAITELSPEARTQLEQIVQALEAEGEKTDASANGAGA